MKRLSYRTRRYQNEYSAISSFYLQFELIGLKANQPWLAHTDINGSNLPLHSFRGKSYAKSHLFLALMSEINVAYCHQEGTVIMKP